MHDRNSLSVAALVLAGGKSSRMGRDKALILWDGITILQRICQVASECCQQVYILTPWPDRYRCIVPPNYHFLPEINSGNGPLVGLAEGIDRISANQIDLAIEAKLSPKFNHINHQKPKIENLKLHNWLLLLACDMPLLEAVVIRNWINELDNIPKNTLALVPKQADRWEPLCAFYRKEALPELQQFIQQGGRSFQSWFKQIQVEAIPVGEQEAKMLSNCNTHEDLERLVN